MFKNVNPNNLSWNDGWGAGGFSIVAASTVTSGIRNVAIRSDRRKEVRWQKLERAVFLKTAVNANTISKEVGAEMCLEIGVDPQFLDNKMFKEVPSNIKSGLSDSNQPPIASISFSNNKTMSYCKKKSSTAFSGEINDNFNGGNYFDCSDTIQYQKPVEYAQVAEVAVPNSYPSSTSLVNSGAKQGNIIFIWGVVFIMSAGLYLIVLSKLKETNWYNKNFGYNESREDWFQKNFDRNYEKTEKLVESQKNILENQNQIIELLKKS